MIAEILLSSAATGALSGLVSYVLARRGRSHPTPCQTCLRDPLTGLGNRRLVTSVLDDLALAEPDGTAIAVMMIDLDRFKAINDTYGHEVGDATLVEVGRRLTDLFDRDLVSRIGGDEFVIIAAVRSAVAARMLAAAAHAAITSPITDCGPAVLRVGASVGLVVTTGPTPSEDVLRAADHAMYQAKFAGGGMVEATIDPHAPREIRPAARLRDVRAMDPNRREVSA